MKQIPEHEALDRILRYLIDNRVDRPINVYKVQKDLFPDQKQQAIFYLIKKRLLNQKNIITSVVHDDNLDTFDAYIGANDLTEIFLNQGGYSGAYIEEQAKAKEEERVQKLQNEKLEAEVDIVRFQKGLGKRLTIWGFIITIVSVLASVTTTIVQNRGTDNRPLIDSLRVKSDSLAGRLIQVEAKLSEIRDTTREK